LDLVGAITAKIAEIKHDGTISVEFNETIVVPDFFVKNGTLKLAIERQESSEKSFSEGYDFNWTTTSNTTTKIGLRINLRDPFDTIPSDIVKITFPSREIFVTKIGKRLAPNNTVLTMTLPNQISHTDATGIVMLGNIV
jgi:hypothetical protein